MGAVKYLFLFRSSCATQRVRSVARRCRARDNQPKGVTSERATTVCRFKRGVTKAARTLLLEDLALATKATFDGVRAKFGTEDATDVTAAVQDLNLVEYPK